MESQRLLTDGKVTVVVDTREGPSAVAKILEKMDVSLARKQLKVGDYVCSERVAVERKTVSDFLGSVFNQRLFRQAEDLVQAYTHPIIMIEGNPEKLFTSRNVNENAIRGALASIAVDYRVPILWTFNPSESASMIYRFAWREQKKERKDLQIRSGKKAATMAQKQEYLIAGLPYVSNMLSQRLLKHFGSPSKVFSAKLDDFQKVDKIGKKKAKLLWEVLNESYH